MDYIKFCENYYLATHIPITLLKDGNPLYSALGDALSTPVKDKHWEMFPPTRNPGFCALHPDLEYGRVQLEGTDLDIVLGPAFNVSLTPLLTRQFMQESKTQPQQYERLFEILGEMPIISHVQFASHLVLIHQCVNGKTIELAELVTASPLRDSHKKYLNQRQAGLENGELHNTYAFEKELYQCVQNGAPTRLAALLKSNKRVLSEGKMAVSPLRHAKNLCISATIKAGMMGAIPGGVDVEKTYQLMDYYIQECERLLTIEAVHNLQYAILMDFCRRAELAKLPEGLSGDVYAAINYIRTHINEPVAIQDVAEYTKRSTSYLMKHFKSELGTHVSAYITQCKLEEAQSLLQYSDMTLGEISSYLCFSSQSYFQNLFKKQYGVTPLQCRKTSRKP